MSVLAVIPARFGSTRFPGKPLADRTGKPLIQHVIEQVRQAKRIDRIAVATDDQRIFDAVQRIGCEVVMTRGDHPNGTSRIAEAVGILEGNEPQSMAVRIVVNVQGDEPDIEPRVIDELVVGLEADPDAPMATLASPFAADEDPANPNIVKLVTATVAGRLRALYFSRSLIPHIRDQGTKAQRHKGTEARRHEGTEAQSTKDTGPGTRDAGHNTDTGPGTRDPGHTPRDAGQYLKHPGLYAYRRDFLAHYVTLPATPLEQAEQLEQLRALEHGHVIAVIRTQVRHHGIDTPEQYEAFVQRSRHIGQ